MPSPRRGWTQDAKHPNRAVAYPQKPPHPMMGTGTITRSRTTQPLFGEITITPSALFAPHGYRASLR